jgi:hypothetical protein
MGRWTIKPSVLVALLGVLGMVLLVLVLPDVDLPDAAFHGGSAPVIVHSRSVTAPGLLTVAAIIDFDFSAYTLAQRWTDTTLSARSSVDSLPILHRALRC